MVARACKEEGVAALFCCPGNYLIVHALAEVGIPTYSGRDEGSLCHAADAFCRATGEIAATSGTEGPGFTDMICGVAAANAARSPILVLASNSTILSDDTERGIQDGYQQPATEGIRHQSSMCRRRKSSGCATSILRGSLAKSSRASCRTTTNPRIHLSCHAWLVLNDGGDVAPHPFGPTKLPRPALPSSPSPAPVRATQVNSGVRSPS